MTRQRRSQTLQRILLPAFSCSSAWRTEEISGLEASTRICRLCTYFTTNPLDGDGQRVKQVYTGGGSTLTTYYYIPLRGTMGSVYEVQSSTVKKYYNIAGQTVAMDDGVLRFEVMNKMGLRSLTRVPGTNFSFLPDISRPGFMGTTVQQFYWYEPNPYK